MPSLAERAAMLRAENQAIVKYPGSGFHDSDKGSPQNQGLCRVSDNVIAFHGRTEVVFAGACADRVMALLADYRGQRQKRSLNTLTGTEQKLTHEYIGELTVQDGLLHIPLGFWNDILAALYSEKLGVTGAPLEG